MRRHVGKTRAFLRARLLCFACAAADGMAESSMDMRLLRGTQREIACECWCTSTGKITPLMIKLKDEEGQIQTIRDITVHAQTKKRYAGIPSIEYDCTLVIRDRYIRAWLIFFQTEGRWVLNLR